MHTLIMCCMCAGPESDDSDLSDDAAAAIEPEAALLSAQLAGASVGGAGARPGGERGYRVAGGGPETPVDMLADDFDDDDADVVLVDEDGIVATGAASPPRAGETAGDTAHSFDDEIPVASPASGADVSAPRSFEEPNSSTGKPEPRIPPGTIAPEALVPSGNPFAAAPAPEVPNQPPLGPPSELPSVPAAGESPPPPPPVGAPPSASSPQGPHNASGDSPSPDARNRSAAATLHQGSPAVAEPEGGGDDNAAAQPLAPSPGGVSSNAESDDADAEVRSANWWKMPERAMSEEELPPPPPVATDDEALLSPPPPLAEQAPLPVPQRGSVAAAAAAFEARSKSQR